MRHLSEGLLRRVHDDEYAASNAQRDHLAGCERCRARMAAVGADADLAGRLIAAGTTGPAVDVESSLAAVRVRAARTAQGSRRGLRAPLRARSRRWAIGLVAAPVLAIALVATAGAEGWLSVFSPTTVAPITLTAGDLAGLPDLSAYGRMHVTEPSVTTVADAGAAAAATGLTILTPAGLPADVPSTVTWAVVGTGSATFTLDPSAASAGAAYTAPQVPGALLGATITVNGGPAVAAVYGASVGADILSTMPALVIAESARPTASTNGATLQQLEAFLLAQPGISARLGAEIRAIGQPASTLPIPVISGAMTSQSISIQGVAGVITGDPSGLGTAVIWEKDGVVHAVAGSLARNEVVDIAQSLH